jgi:hypothetical protein
MSWILSWKPTQWELEETKRDKWRFLGDAKTPFRSQTPPYFTSSSRFVLCFNLIIINAIIIKNTFKRTGNDLRRTRHFLCRCLFQSLSTYQYQHFSLLKSQIPSTSCLDSQRLKISFASCCCSTNSTKSSADIERSHLSNNYENKCQVHYHRFHHLNKRVHFFMRNTSCCNRHCNYCPKYMFFRTSCYRLCSKNEYSHHLISSCNVSSVLLYLTNLYPTYHYRSLKINISSLMGQNIYYV